MFKRGSKWNGLFIYKEAGSEMDERMKPIVADCKPSREKKKQSQVDQ